MNREEKVAIAEDAYHTIPRALSPEDFRELGQIFCREYEPAFPVTYYRGTCNWYLVHKRKHCGCAFVSKEVCLTGRMW